MTNPHALDVGELRRTASEWHGGKTSALYGFASTGVISNADRFTAEATSCMNDVEADPERYADSDGELDRLYELVSYAETHRPHYHLWSNVEGYAAEDATTCFADAAECLDAYVDLVRSYADDEDERLLEYLAAAARGEEYPCGCGHHHTAHSETPPLPCEDDGCRCQGYQPDYGDDAPAVRATVDAALADDPPELGRPHRVVVLDAEDWRSEFHLDITTDDTCHREASR